MKQVLILMGAIAAVTQAGWGATICAPGTLATYIALGSAGCTIGTDTVGMFETLSGQAAAVAIDASGVLVTPSGSSSAPTLTFDFSVQSTATLEAIFSYRIFGNTFTGSTITASNSVTTGDGSVTAVQNLCGNGTFGSNGVSGCTGTTLGPLVVVSPDTDQTTFAGVAFLSVTDDFTIDGGTAGSASAGRFVDRFTAAASTVPEPDTVLVTGLGMAVLFAFIQRRRKTLSLKGRICEFN